MSGVHTAGVGGCTKLETGRAGSKLLHWCWCRQQWLGGLISSTDKIGRNRIWFGPDRDPSWIGWQADGKEKEIGHAAHTGRNNSCNQHVEAASLYSALFSLVEIGDKVKHGFAIVYLFYLILFSLCFKLCLPFWLEWFFEIKSWLMSGISIISSKALSSAGSPQNKHTLDGWGNIAVISQIHDCIDKIFASTSSRHIKELRAHSRWECLANLFFYCVALSPGNIHKHTHHSHVPTRLASRPILLPSIHCPILSRSSLIVSLTKPPHSLLHTLQPLPLKADSSASSLPAFDQMTVIGGCPVYHPGLCPLDASCKPHPGCD